MGPTRFQFEFDLAEIALSVVGYDDCCIYRKFNDAVLARNVEAPSLHLERKQRRQRVERLRWQPGQRRIRTRFRLLGRYWLFPLITREQPRSLALRGFHGLDVLRPVKARPQREPRHSQ